METSVLLTFEEIVKLKNSKEFILLEKYYSSIRTLDLFNYYGQENPHTNFLTNLFKADNPYTNNDKPFKLLSGLLNINAKKQNINNCDIFEKIYLNNCKIDNLNVYSQFIINSSSELNIKYNKRPDITMKFNVNDKNYIILLEAKINAEENDAVLYKNKKKLKQTELYRTMLEDNDDYNDFEKYYVFLSALEEPNISDQANWITITYQDLVDYVLYPCAIESYNVNMPLTIDEYIRSYSDSTFKQEIGGIKLATTPQEKELVQNLWRKYSESLIKIFKLLIENINNDNCDTEYNLVNSFFENNKFILSVIYDINDINKNDYNMLFKKNRKHYFNNISLCNTELFCQVVIDIIENEKIKNIEEFNNIVTFNKTNFFVNDLDKTCSSNEKWKLNYKEVRNNGCLFKLENKQCYYWRNISEEDIQKFIDNVKVKYPNRYSENLE